MARFLHDSGVLIQHIPRTGGTFVEHAIDRLCISSTRWLGRQNIKDYPKKHALLSHYYWGQLAEVRHVVCFVRHPVDYYVSVWQYLHSTRQASRRRLAHLWTRWRWHPHRQAALLYRADFCEWAEAVLEAEPCWATRLMTWYVGPEDGEYCTFIGRTDTLIPDLLELLPAFGYEVSEDVLIGIGKANAFVGRVEVPDELRARIEREERVLIRRFYGAASGKRWYRRLPRNPRS